jgi:hypothetical protein
MAEIDYDKDMEIDPDALDVEWLEQGHIAKKYIKNLTKCNKRVRQLQERKKTIRSELILKVNQDPERLIGKAKPNAADIEAYYRTHKDYKEAIEELNEALEEAEFADLGKNEICFTRKKALENLVVLHGQMYFAGPQVPRDLSKEWAQKQRQKKTDSGVARKLRRT